MLVFKKLYLKNCLIGLFALLSGGILNAQEKTKLEKVELKEIEISAIKTPELSFSGAKIKKTPRSREWLELDVSFKIKGRSTSNDYLNQLTVKYYVMLSDKKTMLTSTVNYKDVPLNEEVWSSVYISPPMIARLFDTDNVSDAMIRGYAIEIIHDGEVVGGDAKPGKKGKKAWWLETEIGGSLLQKSKTPFRYLWWDRYAEEIAD